MNSQAFRNTSADQAKEVFRQVDLGGRSLALVESGRGPVTVIFETGLVAESTDWAPVQSAIAALARTVRYDRAGRGKSTPGPKARTTVDLAADLHEMLRRASIVGPFVLVGQSLGGAIVRQFAHMYPGQVLGLVFVDSMHPAQFERFGSLFPPPAPGEPEPLTKARSFWLTEWRNPETTVEFIDLPESLRQDEAITTLGRLPIKVLIAGASAALPGMPPPMRPVIQGAWEQLQRGFLALSPNASITLVQDSGHHIQRDQPVAVTSAVSELLSEVSPANLTPVSGGAD